MDKYFYSSSTGGVYRKGVHGDIPADALAISDTTYTACFAETLAPGKVVMPGQDGMPQIVDMPIASPDPATLERLWRDGELASVMWLRERHRDQVEIEADTTLSTDQFKSLLVYVQALRDWPQSPEFPDRERRPVALAWLSEQQNPAHASN